MLKKIFAVILLIAVLSAFLVVFGGIALIDISIKLMWLSFSAIVAFACNSLGWNISLEIVNKFLAKQRVVPGTLAVSDAPSIKTDKIILTNLRWTDAGGAERLLVHEVEVRANIYQVLLCLIKKEPADKFLNNVQEIILKQPHFNMEYTLDKKKLLNKYEQITSSVDVVEEVVQEVEPALHKLKLYLERGTVDLTINGQVLRVENINGVWRNDPVSEHYLTCQLEDENITLQNQNGTNRYVLRASKIALKQVWNVLVPIIKIPHVELLDGDVTDFKCLLERTGNSVNIVGINWALSDISLAANGVVIEEIDGKFSSTDLDTFNIKKLELKVNNHTLRVNGTVYTPQNTEDAYTYKLKLRSEKIFLKNNVDLNIFDGFNLQGSVRRQDKHTLADIFVDGMLRLDFPGHESLLVEDFSGTLDIFDGKMFSKNACCFVNGSKLSVDDATLDLRTGEYELHLSGQNLDIALLTDQPISGETFFYTTISGSTTKRAVNINGIYRIEKIKYRSLPLSSIHGRILTDADGCKLSDNYWLIFEKNIPIHCTFEHGAIRINWGLEVESLKEFFKDSVQNAGNDIEGLWNKVRNNLPFKK